MLILIVLILYVILWYKTDITFRLSLQSVSDMIFSAFIMLARPGSVPIHLLHTSLTRLCLSNGEAKTMLFYVVLVNTKARTKELRGKK